MSKPVILSVDDSRMIQRIVAKIFADFHCELIFASDGQEGLATAARTQPDLILLDVTMPVMDGLTMLSELKADPVLKKTPVVMLTAEAASENVVKIAKMGVRDYVVKPFTAEALLERVTRLVQLPPKPVDAPALKSLDDPISLLLIDDSLQSLESIQAAYGSRPWSVCQFEAGPDATKFAVESGPNIILISLAAAPRLVQGLLHELRSEPRTQRVPILGLLPPGVDADAGAAGMSAVVPLPIDPDTLLQAIIQALKIEGHSRFFTSEGPTNTARFPARITPASLAAIGRDFLSTIREMGEAGRSRLILDASAVAEPDVQIVGLIARMIERCGGAEIATRLVGSPAFAEQAANFADLGHVHVFANYGDAAASFETTAAA